MDQAVSLEFLVEGEHGSLGGWVDVTGPAAAAKEELGGSGWNGSDCGGSGAGCELGGGDSAVVPGTASTAVVDGGGVDWSVGDLDGHCDFGLWFR